MRAFSSLELELYYEKKCYASDEECLTPLADAMCAIEAYFGALEDLAKCGCGERPVVQTGPFVQLSWLMLSTTPA